MPFDPDPTAPRLGSSALLTIDTQLDTLDGHPFAVAGTTAAAASLARLCDAFRLAGRPIVHVVRLYLADGSNAELSRRARVRGTPLLRSGTPGRSLAPGLAPAGSPELDDKLLLRGELQPLGPGEWAMFKPRWGAFYGTPLDAHLAALVLDTVVVGGCNFPNCPRATIVEASERDFRVLVPAGAVSGLDGRAAEELRGLGVHVEPVAQVTEAVGAMKGGGP